MFRTNLHSCLVAVSVIWTVVARGGDAEASRVDVSGSWRAVFMRGGEAFAAAVRNYARASDTWYRYYADAFSIWF